MIAVVVDDFTTVNAPDWTTGTVAVDGGDTTGVLEPGGVPCATAESFTDPLFKSACVTVYVAEHVSLAPGASTATGHVGPDVNAPAGAVWESVTPTLLMVTFPVFVTTNEYVMT